MAPSRSPQPPLGRHILKADTPDPLICDAVYSSSLGGKKVKEAFEPQNKPQSEFILAVDSVKYLDRLPFQKHAARPRILPKR